MSIIEMENVFYQYDKGTKNTLKDINLTFDAGKLYALVGKSGSGKSTLLSLLAGLDLCSKGRILYKDVDISTINRDRYRAKYIGVIFQDYNLLTTATAMDNVILSMDISEEKIRNKKQYASDLLNKVGIDAETMKRKVRKLSGGEQQRIGIACAISHDVDLIIADEPTSNLDKDTEEQIMDILTKLAKSEGKCVVIVTHSKKVASYADVTYHMNHGTLEII